MKPTPTGAALRAKTMVIIPSRLASTRLPRKPLAEIAGKPMIVHVWERAREAEIGRVAVATDSAEIADAIRAAGGEAVMTREDHPSGSDRIWEAVERIDPDGNLEFIVNVQGDLPTTPGRIIAQCLEPLLDGPADISTLAAEIARESEKTNPNVVKLVGTPIGPNRMRALYFTRATAPSGDGPLYHHIGLYGYRRAALQRFVSLPPSVLERRERLEQLRALEAGMRIDAAIVDTVPLGVDTPADLEEARRVLGR
jgi:3-deoxy-manno-octulosonate cytidylyltransferase (CMP-KDO synthetase)